MRGSTKPNTATSYVINNVSRRLGPKESSTFPSLLRRLDRRIKGLTGARRDFVLGFGIPPRVSELRRRTLASLLRGPHRTLKVLDAVAHPRRRPSQRAKPIVDSPDLGPT